MLKKLLITSATAVLASNVAVAAAPYVGAGLGITSMYDKITHYRSVPFNLLAGYGGMVNSNLYLAGELGATVATGELNGSTMLKTNHSYQASVIPGVMLSDHTMAFARAGVVNSRFTKAKESSNGGLIGLGLQTSLTQNVDVRGEYDYTAYRSLKHTSSHPHSDAFNVSLIYKFE